MTLQNKTPVGRFAPSPSGRLHLGNVLCALLSWLSVRSQNGNILLRVEDLDTARCASRERIEQMIDDLHWLGLTWDGGEDPASFQSARTDIYAAYFEQLKAQGLIYPCYCTRAELHAASAPHAADGIPVYDGKCRRLADMGGAPPVGRNPAWRMRVPCETVAFTDGVQGAYAEALATACGDVLLRRSDGVFAYQLAVVVDDGLSGVTEVVRGRDLLSSTPRQIYLHTLLGFTPPQFYHIPLLTREDGTRLAKRDAALDMGVLRETCTPEMLLGRLAYTVGLIDQPTALTAYELIPLFDWAKIPKQDLVLK